MTKARKIDEKWIPGVSGKVKIVSGGAYHALSGGSIVTVVRVERRNDSVWFYVVALKKDHGKSWRFRDDLVSQNKSPFDAHQNIRSEHCKPCRLVENLELI